MIVFSEIILLQYILPTIYLVQQEMGILHVWPPLLQLCNLPQLYIHRFRYLESDENQVSQNQDFAALIPGPKKFIQAKSLCIRDSYQFKIENICRNSMKYCFYLSCCPSSFLFSSFLSFTILMTISPFFCNMLTTFICFRGAPKITRV